MHPHNKDRIRYKIGHTVTRLGLFGIGVVLGWTYYQKIYGKKTKQKADESKLNDNIINDINELQLNPKNITLPPNIDKMYEIALSAALSAGKIIKKYINDTHTKSNSMKMKSTTADIVTEIDKKCENTILSLIKSSFPTHSIIAEESCIDPNNHNITNNLTWFIDPIDGTTNFVHGLPFISVSIGLRLNKIAILGVVHCPILNETFYGILGKGSYLIEHYNDNNKIKLKTNVIKFNNSLAMKKALILTEVAYDRSLKWVDSLTRRIHNLLYLNKIRGLRMFGCCSINMCWIACGRADIFYEGRNHKSGPKPWDYTAAEIIVYEAGGITCLPEGKMFDCTQGRVLCCNDIDTAKYLINMKLYTNDDALD